ncbi:GNAT family N-acetyltransferase [candidate division KSB1 bacterium]
MKIIDLNEAHHSLYFHCLEDWSDEMKEAGNHKEIWFNKMKDKGLAVKLALDDEGNTGGMIQYLPIEHSFAEGKELFVIICIWVHGHKQGRGNFQKKGMGKALLSAAEEDVKSKGGKALVAWGLSIPAFMRAAWFKKQGYKKVDKDGIRILLWKPFTPDANPPKWIRQKRKPQKPTEKVTVTAFINGWCPAMNMAYERAKRASKDFPDMVDYQIIDTSERNNLNEWGITDGLYINEKKVRLGPPPSYKKIHKKITKKVRKFKAVKSNDAV